MGGLGRACARLRAVLASLAASTAPAGGGGAGGRPRTVRGFQRSPICCESTLLLSTSIRSVDPLLRALDASIPIWLDMQTGA